MKGFQEKLKKLCKKICGTYSEQESIIHDWPDYFPSYLSPESKEDLYKGLSDFPDVHGSRIYSSALLDTKTLYQGDGVSDFPFPKFGESLSISSQDLNVIIVSNTCDISLENKRNHFAPYITLAPLMKYSVLEKTLRSQVSSKSSVEEFLKSLKKQKKTNLLYLPASSRLQEEFVARLDMTISIPLSSNLVSQLIIKRKFSLSDFGFYLFLIKISMHLNRINEKVDRRAGTSH